MSAGRPKLRWGAQLRHPMARPSAFGKAQRQRFPSRGHKGKNTPAAQLNTEGGTPQMSRNTARR
eukprot:10811658-Alexandrium_andersonii.AAC.1